MKINNQVMTSQKYPLTFKGEDKEEKSGSLLKNTAMAVAVGGTGGGLLAYFKSNKKLKALENQIKEDLNNKKVSKEFAEKQMKGFKIGKLIGIGIVSVFWGTVGAALYLGYRGVKSMLNKNDKA